MENNVGIPKIPQNVIISAKVDPPKLSKIATQNDLDGYQHSWQLIFHLLVEGGKNLPRIVKSVLIPLAIVTAINIAIESIPTYSTYGITKVLLLLLVFVTASYNSFIPRTVFWVVIFTTGKTLFRRVKGEGISKVIDDFRNFPDNLKESRLALGGLSKYLIITGAGLGFIAANFLSRNNRIDKIAVCLILAISLINTLSKGKKCLLFTALRLIHKDITGFNKNARIFTSDHSYIIVSGFILGLVLNTIFAFIKLSYGGYILGGIMALIGFILVILNNKEVKEDRV